MANSGYFLIVLIRAFEENLLKNEWMRSKWKNWKGVVDYGFVTISSSSYFARMLSRTLTVPSSLRIINSV